MGTQMSVQTTVTDIDNNVISSLTQKANASSKANCDIKIGSISMEETDGCSFEIVNMCSSDASASFDAVLDIMKQTAINMTVEQKTATASLLTTSLNVQTSITNISDNFENYVNQECEVESSLNNSINVESVFIKKCISKPTPTVFKFINSGQSRANCVLKIVAKLKADSVTSVSVATSMGTNWVKILKYVAVAVTILVGTSIISGILIYMIKSLTRTPKERLRSEYFKSDNSNIYDKYLLI